MAQDQPGQKVWETPIKVGVQEALGRRIMVRGQPWAQDAT
jgi:hypothetical protein